MAEITGGELQYVATMDVSQIKTGLADSEKGIKGFTQFLDELGKKTDSVFNQMADNAASQKKFIADLEAQYANLNKVIEGLSKPSTNTAFADEKQQLSELEPLLAEYKNKYEDLRNQLVAMQQEMSATGQAREQEIATLKNQANAYQETLDHLKNQLQNAIDGNKIGGEVEKVIGKVEDLGVTVKETVTEMSKSNDVRFDFGITRENISIQKQIIKELEASIKEVQDRASKMGPGIAQATIIAESKELQRELDGEKKALTELETALKSTTASTTTLSTKFLAAKNTLAELTLANKQGTPEFAKAEAEVKRLGLAINETNKNAKTLSSGGGFSGVIQSASLLSGGLAAAQSVMGIFGGENENLNKIMLKTQALMSVSITLQQLQTSVTTGGILSTASLTTAKNFLTAANTRLAVALGISNIAATVLMATLTVGLSVVITGVIIALNKLNAKYAENAEINKKVADSIAEPLSMYKKLQMQWNSLGNDLNAKKKFITENADEFKNLGVEVDNVSDAENVLVKQSSAFTEAMISRARAAAYAQSAVENFKKSLDAQNEVDEFKEQWKDAGFFGKIGLGAKAIFTNLDDTKSKKFSDKGEKDIKKQIEEELEAENKLREAGIKSFEKTKKERVKKEKVTKEKKADEYLPPGSVAEIQKRMSEINKALSKSTNSGEIEKLKQKRISVALELADAIKKIEIKSVQERASLQEKYAQAYAIIAEKQGKEEADKMYGPLMDGAQSYYGWLDKEREKLLQKQDNSILTEKDKEDLVFVTKAMSDMEGKKNAFQNFTDGIDEALRKIPTLAGQIEFLQNKAMEQLDSNGNKSFDDGEQKFLEEKRAALLIQAKDNYQSLLQEQQTYQEKSLALQEEFLKMQESDSYKNDTPENQAKINKSFSDKQGVLDIDMIKKSKEWEVAFGELEGLSNTSLQTILAKLLEFKEKSKGTLSLQDSAELTKAIERVKAAANNNPFTNFTQSLSGYFGALKTAKTAQLDYNKAVETFGAGSKQAIAAQERMIDADIEAADKKKKLIAQIQEGQAIFNAAGNGVKDLGDMFGGFDDATNDAIESIMDIGNAAMDLGTAIASGDIAGMIKAGVALIGSVWKAINGDKKKERDIKKQAAALKELENAYNAVAFAAERMVGSQKYSGQRDLIRNLEQQKIALQSMANSEASKKKKDQGKIAEYNAQMQAINQSIIQLKEGIIKDVLQDDLQGMASKIGDALLEAFGKGEDGIAAVNRAFDDMVKNILKNQLNKVLEEQMEGVYKNILAAAGFDKDGNGAFNGFTPDELEDLKAQYQKVAQNGNALAEAISAITGGAESITQGMRGDLKGITEKTAGAFEGQINAMRINQVSSLEIFRASLIQFVLIEGNTRNLIQIRQDIAEMNSKMQKGLAGFP